MLIIKNKKKYDVETIFGTFDDFLKFLKDNNYKLNLKNKSIHDDLNEVYQKLIHDEGNVKWLRFSRWLSQQLGFKHKNVVQKEFWIERGFTEDEAKSNVNEILKERKRKGVETSKKRKNEIRFDGGYYKIKYKTVEYETDEHPTCNECGSKLTLIKRNIKNLRDKFYYEMKGCSNDNCPSHNFRKTDKYYAYLPRKVAEQKHNELLDTTRNNNRLFVEYWINRGYTESEAKEKIFEIQSYYSNQVKNRFTPSKENLRNRGFSKEEIYNITLTPVNADFWIKKGYNHEKAENKVKEHQKHAVKFVNFDNKILPSNIQYWLNKGFSEEEAYRKRSERQRTFTKEKCIEKYGEKEGLKRFNERQRKWQNSLYNNGNMKRGYSRISQELFYELLEHYNVKERENISFATHNGEFKLDREKDGGIWAYDFTDNKNKKIIEYNGDDYHGNPKKYLAEDRPHPFRKEITAKEIWEKDDQKINIAKENGFDVLIIWDSEYRWGNKQRVINKCLEFLNKK